MDRFFQYLNAFPLPLWLAMMFAPRHPLTERAGRSSTIFGLAALHYVVALFLAVRQSRTEGVNGGFSSLRGVNALLGTRGGSLAAWAHMLALDLFTGAWIYRQCRRLDAPAWVRIPSLFGTLMAGPVGLLYFLGWRAWRTRDEAFVQRPVK
jgi:hypothetical protein